MANYSKTTPGAPTSGLYTVGDWVVDSVNVAWQCVLSGQPGEWVGRLLSNPGTAETITGFSAREYGDHVTFTFADMELAVTDALAYASKLLYTFPAGRIYVIGGTAALQFGVTTDRDTTINNSASLTWAVGSVAASNITLSSTMVDIVAKQTRVLAAATTAYNTVTNANVAAAQFVDGTTTALKLYLNVGFETNTDIDANGTLKVQGSFTVGSAFLGDY